VRETVSHKNDTKSTPEGQLFFVHENDTISRKY